jgi:hypothetical protein
MVLSEVPSATNCGLKELGLPSEQYTKVLPSPFAAKEVLPAKRAAAVSTLKVINRPMNPPFLPICCYRPEFTETIVK